MTESSKPQRPITLRWYRKVALVGVGLLFSLLLVEIAGRVLDLLPHTADSQYQAISRRVGELNAPYDSFVRTGEGSPDTTFEVDIELNRLGFRTEDVDPDPPADTRRVLLFGDSYTAGWEVDQADMWSSWLTRALNAGDQAFEVVNLGVPGFGTAREYLLYEAYGRELHPDMVVLVMYLENDVLDNSIGLRKRPGQILDTRPFFLLDEAGNLVEYPWHYHDKTRPYLDQAFPDNVISWLNAHSVTYRILRGRLGQTPPTITPNMDDANIDPLNPTIIAPSLGVLFSEPIKLWETSWAITENLIAEFQAAVEADGAEFAIVLVPPHMLVQNDTWQFNELFAESGRAWDLYNPQRRLTTITDEAGIPFLNLTQEFLDFRETTGQDLFWVLDRHFNTTGTCLFGTLLANWFVEQGYAPADSTYPRDPYAICN